VRYGDLTIGAKLRKAWLMMLPRRRFICENMECGVEATSEEQLTAHQRAREHGRFRKRSSAQEVTHDDAAGVSAA